jgi:hypothetical protein
MGAVKNNRGKYLAILPGPQPRPVLHPARPKRKIESLLVFVHLAAILSIAVVVDSPRARMPKE